MSMRTPLRNVRGLGSARSGTEHFWLQRVTAVANVPLTLAFLVILICLAGESHATVVATLGSPLVSLVMLLTLFSVVLHMKLGMQIIIEDYIHGEGMKIVALLGNTFFTIVVGLAGAFAILKISFGV